MFYFITVRYLTLPPYLGKGLNTYKLHTQWSLPLRGGLILQNFPKKIVGVNWS